MRISILAAAALTLGLVGPAARADDPIPTPSLDRVDYAHPEKYAEIGPAFGDAAAIRRVAATLRSDHPRKTLAAIGGWMDANLKYDEKAGYTARNYDAIVGSKAYGSCAEHSIVFAALAKACGIPTVTVKTIDVAWIRRFRATGETGRWDGHVFLEVFIDGRWRLLDAVRMRLTDDYDTAARILPGNRLAYDKGPDPFALPLSCDWERWKVQTRDYFGRLDLAVLPVAEGSDVDDEGVYIAANSPAYQALVARVADRGYRARMSFNTDYDRNLADAKGKILISTCVGRQSCPPAAKYAAFLPIDADQLRRAVEGGESGVARRTLGDGTRSILIYAPDLPRLMDLIRGLEVTPAP